MEVNGDRKFIGKMAGYKKIIGWGTGSAAQQILEEGKIKFDYLIDGNPTKVGMTLDNIQVKGSISLIEEDVEETLIIVLSSFYEEIKDTIYKIGKFDLISYEGLTNIEQYEITESIHFNKSTIITMSNNDYTKCIGGTEKVLKEQNEDLQNRGIDTYHIYPIKGDMRLVQSEIFGLLCNGKDKRLITLAVLKEMFEKENEKYVWAVIIHNLIGYDSFIKKQIINMLYKTKVFCYMHDYSWICNNPNLLFNNQEYCKLEKDMFSKCDICKNNKGNDLLRRATHYIFSKSNVQIICPSEDVAERIKTIYYNDIKNEILIFPHQTYKVVEQNSRKILRLKIAYLGYQGYTKGWETFEEMVKKYKNYDFYVLGKMNEKIEGVTYIDVSFQSQGPYAMVNALLQNDIDIAFLWSICPETYSFTYYESSMAGAFIITNSLSGNISRQVSYNKNGIVLVNEEQLYSLLNREDTLKELVEKNRFKIANLELNTQFYQEVSKNKN